MEHDDIGRGWVGRGGEGLASAGKGREGQGVRMGVRWKALGAGRAFYRLHTRAREQDARSARDWNCETTGVSVDAILCVGLIFTI
jgi:hypothetical protein